MAIDSAGGLYVIGYTESSDFPLANAYESMPASGFVSCFDPSGTTSIYSTYLGTQSGATYLSATIAVHSTKRVPPQVPRPAICR